MTGTDRFVEGGKDIFGKAKGIAVDKTKGGPAEMFVVALDGAIHGVSLPLRPWGRVCCRFPATYRGRVPQGFARCVVSMGYPPMRRVAWGPSSARAEFGDGDVPVDAGWDVSGRRHRVLSVPSGKVVCPLGQLEVLAAVGDTVLWFPWPAGRSDHLPHTRHVRCRQACLHEVWHQSRVQWGSDFRSDSIWLSVRTGADLTNQCRSILDKLRYVDHAVYRVIADSPIETLDEPLRRLSKAANYSRLWLAISSVLYVFGGRKTRRATLSGVAAIAVTSFLVNVVVKSLSGRTRPDRDAHAVPDDRKVPMPDSTSFPSGHSASGFAFATAVGNHLPSLAVPLRLLAGAVAYSRLHSGVHYPADVLFGSVIGIAIGHIAARAGGSRSDA